MKVNRGVNIHWVVDSSLRSLFPSRRRLVAIEVRATLGEPADLPYAHLERLNGAVRNRLGYLTRKTHGSPRTSLSAAISQADRRAAVTSAALRR